jgi:hypothetical protein
MYKVKKRGRGRPRLSGDVTVWFEPRKEIDVAMLSRAFLSLAMEMGKNPKKTWLSDKSAPLLRGKDRKEGQNGND